MDYITIKAEKEAFGRFRHDPLNSLSHLIKILTIQQCQTLVADEHKVMTMNFLVYGHMCMDFEQIDTV